MLFTMRIGWDFLGEPVEPPAYTLTDVLIEYDGPQLCIVEHEPGAAHLAVCSDHDTASVRWIHAPMTPEQRDAMMRGRLPLYDIFRAGDVWVIDCDHYGQPTRAWRTSGASVPDVCLPKKGALLPGDLQTPGPQPKSESPR